MKKLSLISAFAFVAIAMTSCSKDYTCTCTTTGGDVSIITYTNTSKHNASQKCVGYQTSGYEVKCELD